MCIHAYRTEGVTGPEGGEVANGAGNEMRVRGGNKDGNGDRGRSGDVKVDGDGEG